MTEITSRLHAARSSPPATGWDIHRRGDRAAFVQGCNLGGNEYRITLNATVRPGGR
jgi:hypothetical protein